MDHLKTASDSNAICAQAEPIHGYTLKFTKMHGLGNDFMVIDAITQVVHLSAQQVRLWGDRKTGIGFDQLLLVEASQQPDTDFNYRIFNADGNEVEQCGNGARCFARFVYEQGLTQKKQISVMTAGGRLVLELSDDGQVTVDMGVPELRPEAIPFISEQTQDVYTVQLNEHEVVLSAVSVGNPHAVLLTDDIEQAPVAELGPMLEQHAAFPQRVNVGFMQVLTAEHIGLRVFERGVGETRACGTGACAAVVAGRLRGLLAEQVRVDLPGGPLQIAWPGAGHSVRMTGPTTTVFAGEITI